MHGLLYISCRVHKGEYMNNKYIGIVVACMVSCCLHIVAQEHPKREFRGVWLPTAWQSRYAEHTVEENKKQLIELLDVLQATGINAVIFQVRPQADAFYPSTLEPWSRHLTGRAGKAPSPEWDPLQFIIEQCHDRNMELHAWINPYRVTLSAQEKLPKEHLYYRKPELFVRYNGKLYFDPGLPAARAHILAVVDDIVARYDVDAIHLDDYFYPYPVQDEKFPDDASYSLYGNGMQRDEWRRYNVNQLISAMHELLLHSSKPWVRLGISPFGIYRNKKSWNEGSDTNGLQCYDDMYADVLLWARNGWIDYLIPQLYWTLQNKNANYDTLVRWWNQSDLGSCHLYIGQDLSRSCNTPDVVPGKNQLERKIELSRYLDCVDGDCLWFGYQLAEEYRSFAAFLSQNYYATPALLPAYTHLDPVLPKEVASLKAKRTPYGYMLEWKPRKTRDEKQRQIAFVVYRFEDGETIDLSSAKAIQTVTRNTAFLLPYKDGSQEYVYVVTAIDRYNNESPRGKRIRVLL